MLRRFGSTKWDTGRGCISAIGMEKKATRVHGKGYATEAVRGRLMGHANIGTAQPTLGGTVWITHPERKRSIRVADKCGFKAVQQTTYKRSQRFCLRGGSWVQVGGQEASSLG